MKAKILLDKIIEPVNAVKSLVNEGVINFKKDGIEILAMDPANVAMVIFRADSSIATEWDVKEDTKVGVNFLNLCSTLKRFKPGVLLEIEVIDNQLILSSGKKVFKEVILAIEDKTKEPELKFETSFKVNTKDLNESILDAEIASDSVTFVANGNILNLKAIGDIREANSGIGISTLLKIDKPVVCKFSIDYLKKMVSAKLNEEVQVELKKDYPLRLAYSNRDARVTYVLAPRVDSEDTPAKAPANEEAEEA